MLETIELIGENGEVEVFSLDATFELDDTKYVILSKENAEDALMMRVDSDFEGNPVFVQIENEQEFNEALKAYESLLKEE